MIAIVSLPNIWVFRAICVVYCANSKKSALADTLQQKWGFDVSTWCATTPYTHLALSQLPFSGISPFAHSEHVRCLTEQMHHSMLRSLGHLLTSRSAIIQVRIKRYPRGWMECRHLIQALNSVLERSGPAQLVKALSGASLCRAGINPYNSWA